MLALVLGGDLPVLVDPVYDGDLLMFKTDGEFGAAFKSGFDLRGNGFDDAWFAAPTLVFDEETRGKIYFVGGWDLDERYPDDTSTTPTEYPVD